MELLETFEKKLWKNSIFRRVARNFSKVFLHFSKTHNSLRQVLQTYSEICIFCVLQKKVLQLAKIDLKVPRKSCDEIDDDVMKFIL